MSLLPSPTTTAAPARGVDSLLATLHPTLRLEAIGHVAEGGERHVLPRIRVRGAYAGHDPITLALFAGLHGDEPAGCTALVEFANALAREPSRAAGYEVFVYPLVNPAGYARGTRANHRGKDLNREFWRGSSEVEVPTIERELRSREFAGIITLHADDTCEGVYGYAHGRTLNEALMVPALAAARRFLPIDARAVIDGFPARAGLICDCFAGVLSAPPEQRPKPFDLIFETPAMAPFDLQVSATVAALEAIIATYPGFIAYAQDL
ncbi:MAG TPA: succinylglutamate desuccinylase/aspartoacylase family protein [Opitutus sp.]|nr:succinylglutamate desuccinylase/aspartoacylase family protein [Opitutus sp.]